MRTFRLLLTICSMSAIAVGGLVACGDDDTGGATPTPGTDAGTSSGSTSSGSSGTSSGSSGTSSSSGGVDSGPQKPTAVATGAAVYLGQTATLDGSGSTGASLTYAWTLTPPAGSTATLQGGNTAKPTFVPDKLGDYAATLTVTSGGQTATANVTLKVVDVPVFFFSQEANEAKDKLDKAAFRVTNVFGGDGDAGTQVACFEQDAGAATTEDAINSKAVYGGAIWSDWWEAPAGQASRAVFYWRTEENGKHAGRLFAVTSADTCAKAPTSIDAVADAESIEVAFDLPRISPNGQRVLYTKQDKANHVRVTTVGFDGSGVHSIADRQVYSDAGPDPDGGRYNGPTGAPGPRPIWLDDTNVAWLTKDDSTHWQIVKAADAENATPTIMMKCTGSLPDDIAVLPSGEILVSQFTTDAADAAASAQNLLAYTIDGATKDCKTPRNISKLISSSQQSKARGMSLSPDKTKVAYVVTDEIAAKTFIAWAAVDGSAPPVIVGNGNSFTASPRWIAGGTQLTWGVPGDAVDGGGATGTISIAVSPVDSDAGGRSIMNSSADRAVSVVSASTNGCSVGYGVGSAVSGLGFLGLLGLGITRRRNKKQS